MPGYDIAFRRSRQKSCLWRHLGLLMLRRSPDERGMEARAAIEEEGKR